VSLPRQSDVSLQKNASFFRDRQDQYQSQVRTLDTYRNIRAAISETLRGVDRLLDIGNGGTFDYDVSVARKIVAVDLFLEDLPAAALPAYVEFRNGSALDLPMPDASFDCVLMSMLLHHLIGNSIDKSWSNVSRAVAEAFRVLQPGGKLVIVESCVPRWFYRFEKVIFPLAGKIISRFFEHPATLQFPSEMIADLLRKFTVNVESTPIPLGRWVLQYGVKYPSALTPVQPYRFVAHKS
jgi:ubiquinone/menaquinone biosynthesis C-methylase UbiE